MKIAWQKILFLMIVCSVSLRAHNIVERQITLDESTVVKEVGRHFDGSVSIAIRSPFFDPFGFLEAAQIFESHFQVPVKSIYLLSESEEIYNLTSD